MKLHVKLGVDSRHADQQVRGAVVLAARNGQNTQVCLYSAKKSATQEALRMPAPIMSAAWIWFERIQKENFFDFDVVIATPDMMGVVGRLGRVLGPKGLMPIAQSRHRYT